MKSADIYAMLRKYDPELGSSSAVLYAGHVHALLERGYTGDGEPDDFLAMGLSPRTSYGYSTAWRKFLKAREVLGLTETPLQSNVEAYLLGLVSEAPTLPAILTWRKRLQRGLEPTSEAARRAFMSPEVLRALRAIVDRIQPEILEVLTWGDAHGSPPHAFRALIDSRPYSVVLELPDGAAHLATLRGWASPMSDDAPVVPEISGSTRPMGAETIRWYARLRMR